MATHDLKKYSAIAADGFVGQIVDLCFDIKTWQVRYLAVDTGSWLAGRVVLISTVVSDVRHDVKTVYIELTKEQIEGSPVFEYGRPISRKYEIDYHEYYNWPPYWEFEDSGLHYMKINTINSFANKTEMNASNICCVSGITGNTVLTNDDQAGDVKDLIIDTNYWLIRYLDIDTGNWLPTKHTLLSPIWIDSMSRSQQSLHTRLKSEMIRNAPEFNPAMGIDRNYELELFSYYGKSGYFMRARSH